MAIDPSWEAVILNAAIAAGLVLVALGCVLGLRQPPEYGPLEIARGIPNPTVTTIARDDLISISFFENGVRVAKAKYWGYGDSGIALEREGDQTEYLFTSGKDWFKDTRFDRLKPDIRLMLLAKGAPIVSAQRLPDALDGWKKGRDGKYTKLYDIDCAEGRFDLVRIERARFALRRGETVLGIVARSEPTGIFSRRKSRIELPESLPLVTRLFLALLVHVEDRDWD